MWRPMLLRHSRLDRVADPSVYKSESELVMPVHQGRHADAATEVLHERRGGRRRLPSVCQNEKNRQHENLALTPAPIVLYGTLP